MPEQRNNILQKSPENTARVALKTFSGIMDAWHVEEKAQTLLLGQPTESSYSAWKIGEVGELSDDTLKRISYFIGIYKALRLLFPIESQANAWLHKSNKAFDGNSALNHMLNGDITCLAEVRNYLDSQLS